MSRDEFAAEAMKVLLAHRLRSPLNQSLTDSTFDMIDHAGSISVAAFELADYMVHQSQINPHHTPPHDTRQSHDTRSAIPSSR